MPSLKLHDTWSEMIWTHQVLEHGVERDICLSHLYYPGHVQCLVCWRGQAQNPWPFFNVGKEKKFPYSLPKQFYEWEWHLRTQHIYKGIYHDSLYLFTCYNKKTQALHFRCSQCKLMFRCWWPQCILFFPHCKGHS